jgi:hypothetical protein
MNVRISNIDFGRWPGNGYDRSLVCASLIS